MKTIKYIIAGAVLAGSMLGGLSLTSCSDLDEHGYTFIDPASFYNTEEEVDRFLDILSQIRGAMGYGD